MKGVYVKKMERGAHKWEREEDSYENEFWSYENDYYGAKGSCEEDEE